MTERGGTSRASQPDRPDRSGRSDRSGRPGRPGRWRAGALAGAGVLAVLLVGGCGDSEPTLADLPAGVAEARPSISAEEADFVLAAQKLGATVTGDTVDDDIETGTTTCWALQNGGVDLAQIAVDDDTGKPLANTGEALRTKQLMAAGVQTFCPDHDDEIGQLRLP